MVYYRYRVRERVFHHNKDKDKKGTKEMGKHYNLKEYNKETLAPFYAECAKSIDSIIG